MPGVVRWGRVPSRPPLPPPCIPCPPGRPLVFLPRAPRTPHRWCNPALPPPSPSPRHSPPPTLPPRLRTPAVKGRGREGGGPADRVADEGGTGDAGRGEGRPQLHTPPGRGATRPPPLPSPLRRPLLTQKPAKSQSFGFVNAASRMREVSCRPPAPPHTPLPIRSALQCDAIPANLSPPFLQTGRGSSRLSNAPPRPS